MVEEKITEEQEAQQKEERYFSLNHDNHLNSLGLRPYGTLMNRNCKAFYSTWLASNTAVYFIKRLT